MRHRGRSLLSTIDLLVSVILAETALYRNVFLLLLFFFEIAVLLNQLVSPRPEVIIDH